MQRRRSSLLIRFGERVKALRKARALSQGELAAKLRVHRPYLSDIERGVRNSSLKTIVKISRSLSVEVASLFRDARAAVNGVAYTPLSETRRRQVQALFGRRVRGLRQQRDWSARELATKVGLPHPYVTSLERGARNPSLLRMGRIAKTLKVDVSDFFLDTSFR